MKKIYKVKDSSYMPVLRDIQKLLQNKVLTFTTLGSYMCFVFQADWDRKHNTYRAILAEDKEIARYLECNETTIYRHKKTLIDKGLLEEIEGNTYVKNIDMFSMSTVKILAKKNCPLTNIHNYYAKPENTLAKAMLNLENMQ